MRDRLIEAWRTRPRLIVGSAIGVLALAGLGAFALNGGKSAGAPGSGPALDIAVVAPVEPDIQPGSRMEVGALVNDFDGAVPQDAQDAATDGPDGYYAEQPAYVGDDPGPPPSSSGRRPASEPERETDWGVVQGRGDRLGLGFDGPRPESGAEREARRGPPQPRERQTRPTGDPGSTFY